MGARPGFEPGTSRRNTHRNPVSALSFPNPVSAPSSPSPPRFQSAERKCFYCHKTSHIIANWYLKNKEQSARASQPKGVRLVKLSLM